MQEGKATQPVTGTIKHHQITKFVGLNMEKTDKEEFTNIGTKRTTLDPTQSANLSVSANCEPKKDKSKPNKRIRPDSTSPDANTDNQPQKKTNIAMAGKEEANNSSLNPELTELKHQLFAGFEQLIEQKLEPLKNDIQELKNTKDVGNKTLNVETLSWKIKQNDVKHEKLEDRLNLIEDQLLERNLIFQGLSETEFDDNDDARVKIIKAMSYTMQGDTEEAKKTKAGQTSIEHVE